MGMRLTFVVIVALLEVCLVGHVHGDQQRPNIVFAFADDWGRFASAYAKVDDDPGLNQCLQTPNFDAIAARGVLFRNAFVNAPSCTPCRSSILSGQYFWRTGRGAILQGAIWDSSIPAWPLMLRDNGYHLGKTWKVWSPGKPADAPYGGQKHAYQKAGNEFNQFSQNALRRVAQGATVDEAKAALLDQVRGNFQLFLAARDGDAPFAYWFGPTNVHRKWVRGSGQQLWGINPDSLQGHLPPFLPDVPVVREDLADYFGEIMAFDAALGVLIEELQAAGELENTLLVVSGDHGPPGFPHGKCNLYNFGTQVALTIAGPGISGSRVVDDFVSLPDLAPTFLEAADIAPPDVMTAKSLWPILQSNESGQVDTDRTWVVTGRERHVASAREEFVPYPQRAIHTKDFVFIVNFHPERYPLGDHYQLEAGNSPEFDKLSNDTYQTLRDEDAGPTKAWLVTERHSAEGREFFERAYNPRPREELYDLRSDPYQMHNVAAQRQYAAVASRFRDQLLTILRESNDPRVVEDGRHFESAPMAGPIPDDAK
jgi:arylsulfatase A-like enzyme